MRHVYRHKVQKKNHELLSVKTAGVIQVRHTQQLKTRFERFLSDTASVLVVHRYMLDQGGFKTV